MISRVNQFIVSNHFTNALKVTISVVLPVLVFYFLGNFQIGFSIALGALLTYPSDIPSSLKHKINGLLVTILLIVGANLIVNLFYPYPVLFYFILPLLIFFLSIISVYGQRATAVSFSALLSLSLSFSNIYSGYALVEHACLILIGGLFYLGISLLFYFTSPHHYLELQIAECIKLTSKYLKLRADLWKINAPREEIIKKQLKLQVELNIIHQELREIVFRNNSSAGSSTQNRKMLIVVVTLIEILELALSTSFDQSKLHQKFSEKSTVLATYQNLAYSLAYALKLLSNSILTKTKYEINNTLFRDLEALEKAIIHYEKKLGKDAASDGVLILSNMSHYAEKQIEKIKIIETALKGSIKNIDSKSLGKDMMKFITPQYYPISILKENLNFSSTIFRHSLRITITFLIGYIVGIFLPFQNDYWILLTIVVIMRPGYGLTKQRSYERIYGTILGGIIAFGIVSLTQNYLLLSFLSVICVLMGFFYTQKNYKIGATFVTIYVVFIFVMLTPNIEEVVGYRILDTVVGAALAFTANYFLWPSWEFLSIKVYIEKSIDANKNYLNEILLFYNKKGETTTSYKLSRRQAFIEIGNLMTSFQRMSQEPKSKQKNILKVYKLVELNHTLLSSAASLGTYVQTHQTSKASDVFNIVITSVIKNLEFSIYQLNNKKSEENEINAKENLDLRFSELKNNIDKELKVNTAFTEEELLLKMEESQLIAEQLVWLTNLSEKIITASQNLNKSLQNNL